MVLRRFAQSEFLRALFSVLKVPVKSIHFFIGVILVYDLTSARSCQRLAYWLQELRTYSFERQDGPGDGSFAS